MLNHKGVGSVDLSKYFRTNKNVLSSSTLTMIHLGFRCSSL